ncbi:MAG: TlpA disulfide reductase family protein [Armatimonadota bacterium]
MFDLKSYRAQCWTRIKHDPKSSDEPGRVSYEMATLVAAKPNLMRYDSWEMTGPLAGQPPFAWKRKSQTPRLTFACDGKTNWRQYGDYYNTDKRTEPGGLSTSLEPWGGFYSRDSSPYAFLMYIQKEKGLLEVRRDGTEAVDGVLCDKVVTHMKTSYEGMGIEYRTTWYVGVKDGLVRRNVERMDFEGRKGYVREATLRNIVVNAPVVSPRSVFAYVPPKGVTPSKPPPVTQRKAPEIKRPPLLANGIAAPDFTATDLNGKSVNLSDYRGKVVILDFWASWCPPCIAAMPHNQAVAKKLQSEGLPVVLLALDNSEAREPFLKWVKDHKELDALTFLHRDSGTVPLGTIAAGLYKVTAIPSFYIIDTNGIIRDSSIGFGGPTDDLEKAVRAAIASK